MTPAVLLAAALLQAVAPEPAPNLSATAAPTPAVGGAPADDYGFVAWCRGALSGHMDLYRQAKPEMERVREEKLAVAAAGKSGAELKRLRDDAAKEARHDVELDREQLKAGQEYVALYNRALQAAEGAGANRQRGADLTGQGYRIWAAARAGGGRDRMYAYLMWELPGRCETAAKTLEQNSGLLGEAFKRAEAPAEGVSQAPAPTADAVAPVPDAPAPEVPPAPELRPSAPAPTTPPGA